MLTVEIAADVGVLLVQLGGAELGEQVHQSGYVVRLPSDLHLPCSEPHRGEHCGNGDRYGQQVQQGGPVHERIVEL
ncbi:hypothetical protein [Streptomyces sp. NBC_00996]|uniref:hypothetical protein n=1 Tax=Streptomyces sp. NBC_00996 TaxID=2903710 RepID=UPI003870B430|nr:hypothetical protein OG390_49655 [Streptomyces sp. NBC_00996]